MINNADTHLEVLNLVSDEDGFAVRVGQGVNTKNSKCPSLSVLQGYHNERALPLLEQEEG